MVREEQVASGEVVTVSYVVPRYTLVGKICQELGLEVEFEFTTNRVLFWHSRHRVVYSCGRSEALVPGSWMSELRTAVDLLNTFT